jgi:hypothetical protein
MRAQNKNECVNPLWDNKLEDVFIHRELITSISGILCARAPHIIAFLPSVFPAKASPMQAPRTKWVTESMFSIYSFPF